MGNAARCTRYPDRESCRMGARRAERVLSRSGRAIRRARHARYLANLLNRVYTSAYGVLTFTTKTRSARRSPKSSDASCPLCLRGFREPLKNRRLTAFLRGSRLEQFRCAGETGEMLRMKEPHDEGLATHIISESCAGRPQGRRRSVDRGTHGPGIEPRNPLHLQGADAVEISGKRHRTHRHGEMGLNPARSETPSTCGRISPGNREVPCLPWRTPRPHRAV